MPESRTPRWYTAMCGEHNYEHGYSAGALAVVLNAMVDGTLTTIRGNTVCPLPFLATYVPRSTDPIVRCTERVK